MPARNLTYLTLLELRSLTLESSHSLTTTVHTITSFSHLPVEQSSCPTGYQYHICMYSPYSAYTELETRSILIQGR